MQASEDIKVSLKYAVKAFTQSLRYHLMAGGSMWLAHLDDYSSA